MGNTTSLFARFKPSHRPKAKSKPQTSPQSSLGLNHTLLIRYLATLPYDDVQRFIIELVADSLEENGVYINVYTLPGNYIGDEWRPRVGFTREDVQCIFEHCLAGVRQSCASEEYVLNVLYIVVEQASREGFEAVDRFMSDLLRLGFYIKEGATGPIEYWSLSVHYDIVEAMQDLYQIGIDDLPEWEGHEWSEEMDCMLEDLCEYCRFYKSVRNLAESSKSRYDDVAPVAEDRDKDMGSD
jgi:hypothetical protein